MSARLRLATVLVAVAVLASGCSGGGSGSGPDETTGGKKATGTPIVVGLINMEDAPVGSFPELRRHAEAAVRYVNEELDGVLGHPIKLEVCTTRGTPESSQACAAELRAKNPIAVLGGIDLGADASVPVFERAGIPYLGMTPLLGEELTSDASFMLAGGTAADLLGQAEYITGTLKAKKMGIIHLDLPGVLQTAVLGARIVLARRGVSDLKIVSEKADAADFVPALKAVTSNNPEVLIAVFPAQGCTRVLQARQALGQKTQLFLPSACAAQQVLDAAGPSAVGAIFAAGVVPYTDTANPEVATYRDKLRRYGGRGATPSVLAQAGFSLVMNLQRLLVPLGDPGLHPAALTGRLKATRNEPSFMGHPYTCDGDQVPMLSTVCSPWIRLLRYEGDGRFTDVVGDWVSGANLVKLFG